MAEKRGVWICDTTLREGGQSMGSSFSALDMLAIAEKLDEFGVPWIECPWPTPEEEAKDEEEKEGLQKVTEFYGIIAEGDIKYRQKLIVFGSTGEKETEAKASKRLKALVKTGLKNFAIFGKTSKQHVRDVLKTSLTENLRMIEDSVKFLKKQGGMVFYDAEHFFDGWLEAPEYAKKTIEAALSGGADVIILCDTNGGMLPEQVTEILNQMLPVFEGKVWGVHMHNDSDFALANTLCAINFGADYAQCTVNGESERVGMPRMTSLLPTLMLKKKYDCFGINSLKGLKSLSEFVGEISNNPVPENQPYVGDWSFSHKAGSHQAGARVDPSLQEHVDPNLVGAKRRMPISGEAGKNALLAKLQELGYEVNKEDSSLNQLFQEIKRLDKKGLHLETANGTFELLSMNIVGKLSAPFQVKRIKPRSNLDNEFGEMFDHWNHDSKAEVEIVIGGVEKLIRVWDEGKDGPVDAINNALLSVLAGHFQVLNEVQLIDYKVRNLKNHGAKGTASKVRVAIVAKTPFGYEKTASVSKHILVASARALIDLYKVTVIKSLQAEAK